MPARKKQPSELGKSLLLLLSGVLVGVLTLVVVFPNKVIAPTSEKSGFNEINNSSYTGDNRIDLYFAFKIDAPKSYYATSDQMLTSYLSTGGFAPPRLVLNKKEQILVDAKGDFLARVWDYQKNDCISVWSTGGLGGIDQWLDLANREIGTLSAKEEIKIGKRTADLYKLSLKKGNVYVAYLPVENEKSLSYFFRTCNENNKEDLINVIKSLKLRADG